LRKHHTLLWTIGGAQCQQYINQSYMQKSKISCSMYDKADSICLVSWLPLINLHAYIRVWIYTGRWKVMQQSFMGNENSDGCIYYLYKATYCMTSAIFNLQLAHAAGTASWWVRWTCTKDLQLTLFLQKLHKDVIDKVKVLKTCFAFSICRFPWMMHIMQKMYTGLNVLICPHYN